MMFHSKTALYQSLIFTVTVSNSAAIKHGRVCRTRVFVISLMTVVMEVTKRTAASDIIRTGSLNVQLSNFLHTTRFWICGKV